MTVDEVNEKIKKLYEKEMEDNPNLDGFELYRCAYWTAHDDYILQEHQTEIARTERRKTQVENEELKKKVFIQEEIIIGEQTENEELQDKIKELENDIRVLKESESELKVALMTAREKELKK